MKADTHRHGVQPEDKEHVSPRVRTQFFFGGGVNSGRYVVSAVLHPEGENSKKIIAQEGVGG